MGAHHHERILLEEGMTTYGPVQSGPQAFAHHLVVGPTRRGRGCVQQVLRQNVELVPHLHGHVGVVMVQRDTKVRGECPRRGGPDEDVHLLAGHPREDIGRPGLDGERHGHRDGIVVGVFHLGFRESGFAGGAPEDRTLASGDVTLLQELLERIDDAVLIFSGERQVGMLEISLDPQAAELGFLALHELEGIVTAFLSDVDLARRLSGVPERLDHLVLDRHAVTIPPRHVGRVETFEGAVLDDDVFEDLVEGMAHVDVAVGEGGAVMKDELGCALAFFGYFRREGKTIPELDAFRLGLRQVRLHGEGGLGDVQCGFIFGHGQSPVAFLDASSPGRRSESLTEAGLGEQCLEGQKPLKGAHNQG
jgi:hypothetical protein